VLAFSANSETERDFFFDRNGFWNLESI